MGKRRCEAADKCSVLAQVPSRAHTCHSLQPACAFHSPSSFISCRQFRQPLMNLAAAKRQWSGGVELVGADDDEDDFGDEYDDEEQEFDDDEGMLSLEKMNKWFQKRRELTPSMKSRDEGASGGVEDGVGGAAEDEEALAVVRERQSGRNVVYNNRLCLTHNRLCVTHNRLCEAIIDYALSFLFLCMHAWSEGHAHLFSAASVAFPSNLQQCTRKLQVPLPPFLRSLFRSFPRIQTICIFSFLSA
ncbi:hypothetical protein Fmac_010956 [Flemingia macrophylla]|uniref:Uncharacterized protein n=1 Tax=Flemingia macrophylla TaxID=520843 RepID=A0ABD1ML22_9FABA